MFPTLKLLFAPLLPWSSTPSSPFAVYQRGKFPINKLTVGISFVLCVNLLLATIPLKCIDFSQSANSSAKDDSVHKKHVWRWCIQTPTSTFSKTRCPVWQDGVSHKRRQSTHGSYGIRMYKCHRQSSTINQFTALVTCGVVTSSRCGYINDDDARWVQVLFLKWWYFLLWCNGRITTWNKASWCNWKGWLTMRVKLSSVADWPSRGTLNCSSK